MSFREVKELRKRNMLDEAMAMAVRDLESDPDNVWNKRSLFWVLYDCLKIASNKGDSSELWTTLDKISQTGIMNLPEESLARTRTIFCLKTYLKQIALSNNLVMVNEEVDKLCTFVFSIQMPIPSEEYSAILDAFLAVDDCWDGFAMLVERWNLDNLRTVDYNERSFTTRDGKTKRYMSLAECAYISYSKALLKLDDVNRIKAFQPRLDSMSDNVQMKFLGYFNAKLLLSINADKDEIAGEVLPFAKRKKNEFWIWQFLSEVFEDDEQLYLACLLRASHCNTKEDFLPNIRIKLSEFFYQREDFPRLKYHVDKYVKCRLANGYRIHNSIQHIIKDSRFQDAQIDPSDPIDYMKITNEIINVNNNNYDDERQISGVITTNKAGTSLFVKFEEGFAFIPQKLSKGITKGDKVKAVIVKSFDKKRNQEGYKCINISKF